MEESVSSLIETVSAPQPESNTTIVLRLVNAGFAARTDVDERLAVNNNDVISLFIVRSLDNDVGCRWATQPTLAID